MRQEANWHLLMPFLTTLTISLLSPASAVAPRCAVCVDSRQNPCQARPLRSDKAIPGMGSNGNRRDLDRAPRWS